MYVSECVASREWMVVTVRGVGGPVDNDRAGPGATTIGASLLVSLWSESEPDTQTFNIGLSVSVEQLQH